MTGLYSRRSPIRHGSVHYYESPNHHGYLINPGRSRQMEVGLDPQAGLDPQVSRRGKALRGILSS